jgi:adenosine deaminase
MGRGTFGGTLCLAAALAVAPAQAAPIDLSKLPPSALSALMHEMPKGGELHLHLAGAVKPESMLAWAAQDGLCIDTRGLALAVCPRVGMQGRLAFLSSISLFSIFLPAPSSTALTLALASEVPGSLPGGRLRPAADALKDPRLRSDMIDSLTTRQPHFRGRSGHDQFFSTFDRFDAGYRRDRRGDMLAEVLDRLAREHTFYAEVMFMPQSAPVHAVSAKAGWTSDLAAEARAVKAAGIERLVPAAVAETDEMEARARKILHCGTAAAEPGCRVTVRYLVQTLRVLAPQETFAQLQFGVDLIGRDRRWVGLQIVAPEDDPTALRLYDLHMRMIDQVTEHGRLARTALHAGELTAAYASPTELSFHVREAVEVGHASRIGHGVDIAGEARAPELAAEMARRGVLVEVNLTSNAVILDITGSHTPYAWLRARGVPTSLSTDDPGILGIDLSHEYGVAAHEGVSLEALETSARNALAFSFMSGQGLWLDPGTYKKANPACRGEIGRQQPVAAACRSLVEHSDKAREQWRHEWLLARFNAQHPGLLGAPQ